jgi:YjgF/chorismate_mutase-like, putative endoribonuclease
MTGPAAGRSTAAVVGRLGAELDVDAGRRAARLAALNALAVARQHLGSLDKVTRVVRLGVAVATAGDVRDQPKVADAASELLQDVFGNDKNPCRLAVGVERGRVALGNGRAGLGQHGGAAQRAIINDTQLGETP